MPFKSEAQRRLMYATMKGADTGVPLAAAKKFIDHDKPGKLPKRVKPGLSSVKKGEKNGRG